MTNLSTLDEMKLRLSVPEDARDIYDRLGAAKDRLHAVIKAGGVPEQAAKAIGRDAARGLSKRDAYDVMNAVDDMREWHAMPPDVSYWAAWHQLGMLGWWEYGARRLFYLLRCPLDPLPRPSNYDCFDPFTIRQLEKIGVW